IQSDRARRGRDLSGTPAKRSLALALCLCSNAGMTDRAAALGPPDGHGAARSTAQADVAGRAHAAPELRSARRLSATAVVLCVLAVAIAYGNSLSNEFALDDSHTIQSNAWIRSLVHVPRYFVDSSTFSTLKTNVDYRPLLQTTYAVNYAIARYDVRAWRLLNLALHLAVALSIFFLGRRLLGSRAIAPTPGLTPRDGDLASLAAAVLFAVHPIGSGCVDYISGRSSSLVAALALPALTLYLRAIAEPN